MFVSKAKYDALDKLYEQKCRHYDELNNQFTDILDKFAGILTSVHTVLSALETPHTIARPGVLTQVKKVKIDLENYLSNLYNINTRWEKLNGNNEKQSK